MARSIRRRLLLILLPVIAAAWLASAVTSYFDTLHEEEEVFDAQLAQSARVLMSLTAHEILEQRALTDEQPLSEILLEGVAGRIRHPYEHKLVFQVWTQPGPQLVLRSENAPQSPLTDKVNGYSDARIGAHWWRVFSLSDTQRGIRVLAGESYAVRQEIASSIALRVLIPVFALLPVLALLLWYAVGRALSPLHRLAREVQGRKAQHLAPVDADYAPLEIEPLVKALNDLFLRFHKAFENEHRFTSDAAHELRTPLAGLKTQAQVALRAADSDSRRNALQYVINAVDHMSRLVDQMLILARFDPEVGVTEPVAVNLCELAGKVVAELDSMAMDRHLDVGVTDQCDMRVQGQPEALEVLIRNLVENALHYTPEGGTVEVNIGRRDDDVVLSVYDSGPGIPEAEYERVLERFYRRAGSPGRGSGLGLSIVRRIAEIHHAEIMFKKSPLGGLRVDVVFPANMQ